MGNKYTVRMVQVTGAMYDPQGDLQKVYNRTFEVESSDKDAWLAKKKSKAIANHGRFEWNEIVGEFKTRN